MGEFNIVLISILFFLAGDCIRDGHVTGVQTCALPISAALGGDVEVPTLTGRGEITIPEGTQSGKTFRLRGKGIRGVRSSYPGDLYCHIQVETPVRLSEEDRKSVV